MRLLLLTNRDFASYTALERLRPLLQSQNILVLQTTQVGMPQAVPRALRDLAKHEQGLLKAQLRLSGGADWPAVQNALSQQLAVPITTVAGVNQGKGFEILQSFQPDLMVSIRFGSILQPRAISVPSLGVINLHSGLLPDYRGVMATFWSLLHGRSHYGYSIHDIVDAGIDTGPIIQRETLPLDRKKDYLSQLLTLYQEAVPALARVIDQREQEGRPKCWSKDTEAGRYYSTPTESDLAQFNDLGLRLF